MNTVSKGERDEATSEPPKLGLSIGTKLAAVASLMALVIVITAASLFHITQTRELRSFLADKAESYAELASQHARSAVAFDDRETAREVFDALALDDELEAIALFSQRGMTIHSLGALSRVGQQAASGVTETRLFQLPDRVLAVAPVQSLEGPRGTLVVELSKRSLAQATAQTAKTTALIGAFAWALGLILSKIIANSLSRRIRAVANAASLGAHGDLGQARVNDSGNDELSSLAWSFNTMTLRLRELISELKHRAATEQQLLAAQVAERTQELATSNAELKWLLDSTSQGVVAVALDGSLIGEASRAFSRWIDPSAEAGFLWNMLAKSAPETALELELGWQQIVDDTLPLELVLAQLPRRLTLDGLTLSIGYEPFFTADGSIERVLVMMSDISADLELARADKEEREFIGVFRRALSDQDGAREFLEECQKLVSIIEKTPANSALFLRSIHTLKGNAAVFGLESIADNCHRIEQVLKEEARPPTELLQSLVSGWKRVKEKFGPLLEERSGTGVLLHDTELQQLLSAIRRGETPPELERRVLLWQGDPLEPRLQRLAEQARSIAKRLGKDDVEVSVRSNGLRAKTEAWGSFWQVAPHALRNCLDHGLESRAERMAAGKHEPAQLSLLSEIRSDRFVVEIGDNGRGTDWERVRVSAKKRGLPSATREHLMAALFADGVTTAATTTLVSGRGVGVGALAEAVRGMGGCLDLVSTPGKGTRYIMSWPLETISASAPPPPASEDRTHVLASA